MQERTATFVDIVRKGGAPPKAAAGYAAGVAYLWGEALFRYLWTNTYLGGWYLYPQRTGDVSYIWLLSAFSSALGFLLVYGIFRRRDRVGSITMWTVILIVSAVIAPLIGEIGTPFGI